MSSNAAKLIEEWWQEPSAGDQSMEDDHQEFWDDVLENAIDDNFTGKKVLDFGCNQGGMLRRIYRDQKFASAVGVDLAQKSIAQANERKGDLPITYIATDDIDTLDTDFDFATSTAVIYLIDDMVTHAKKMFNRLKPGGVYYATHPDYITSPAFKVSQDAIDIHAAIKCAQNNVDDIIGAFEDAGFVVYVQRIMPKRYIPVPISARNNRWYGTATNELDFWYGHRYAFKCVKPAK
ncbi:MAG: class I SAM-dependent methyltransferase [Alphaproteobacteria bacterium]|nr:class I SAM-dependent methyltransferase [Alphaproteobacteria bacterium]